MEPEEKNKHTTTRSPRIPLEDEKRLYRAIDEALSEAPRDSKKNKAKKAERRANLESFWKRTWSLNREDKRARRLTYETLPEVLDIVGMSYRDFFEIITTEEGQKRGVLSWPTEIEAKMCDVCDKLTEEERLCVYRCIVDDITPKAVLTMCPDDAAPITRAFTPFRIFSDAQKDFSQKAKELGVATAYSMYTRTPKQSNDKERALAMHDMPKVSVGLNVSLHYILNPEKGRCVLAEHYTTELIMDYFCFLPKWWQESLLFGVEVAAKKKGGAAV